jgi:hypothetical protein
MRLTRSSLALAGALTLALAGTAQAAIPNNQTGVYSACMANATGALRLIDFQASGNSCTATEKIMGWNTAGPKGATGPQGPAGPAGPKGATGPQGPAGVSFARGHVRNDNQDIGTSYTTLATVDLTAGLHQVSGKANVYIGEAPFIEVWAVNTCRLLQKASSGAETVHDVASEEIGDDYNDRASMSMMGLAYVPAGHTDKLHLQCKDDGLVGGELNSVNNVKLIAAQVGGYTAKLNGSTS